MTNRESALPESESLRTRIAAAIYDHPNPLSEQQCREVADAVIAELGLDRQAHYDPDCPYYRYVTDWMSPTDDTAENVNDG